MHSTYAVLYCHLWPVRLCYISPHYLIGGMIFRRKKRLLNIECVFWFSLQTTSLVAWLSELLTTNHEVPGSIPGSTMCVFPWKGKTSMVTAAYKPLYSDPPLTLYPSVLMAQAISKPNLFPYNTPNMSPAEFILHAPTCPWRWNRLFRNVGI